MEEHLITEPPKPKRKIKKDILRILDEKLEKSEIAKVLNKLVNYTYGIAYRDKNLKKDNNQ